VTASPTDVTLTGLTAAASTPLLILLVATVPLLLLALALWRRRQPMG
jgi:hypothetical protein